MAAIAIEVCSYESITSYIYTCMFNMLVQLTMYMYNY